MIRELRAHDRLSAQAFCRQIGAKKAHDNMPIETAEYQGMKILFDKGVPIDEIHVIYQDPDKPRQRYKL